MRIPLSIDSVRRHAATLLRDIGEALAPRRCLVCHKTLGSEEEHVCTSCFAELPFTRLEGREGNGVERIFWAKLPIRRANALLHYHHDDLARELAIDLKYRNNPDVGVVFGRIMAEDLADTDFFQDIDAIVPVPLSAERLRERGYNQSLMLAKGISEQTGLPIHDDAIVRTKDNPTQTGLSKSERDENVRGIFHLVRSEGIKGKHLLLVDDVVTTGATLISAGQTLAKAEGVSLSVMTLFVAGRHSEGADIFDDDFFNKTCDDTGAAHDGTRYE